MIKNIDIHKTFHYYTYNIRAFTAIIWKNIKIKYIVRRIYLINELSTFIFFFLQIYLLSIAFNIKLNGNYSFLLWSIVGFLVWNLSGRATSGAGRALYNEMDEGMFPIVLTSPTPILLIVIAHLFTEILIWIPITLFAMIFISMFYVHQLLQVLVSLTLLLIAVILAYIGFGLLINAIVTLRPYLQFIIYVIDLFNLLLSGAFYPLNLLPLWVLLPSQLLPVKHAIDIARAVTFGYKINVVSILILLLLINLLQYFWNDCMVKGFRSAEKRGHMGIKLFKINALDLEF